MNPQCHRWLIPGHCPTLDSEVLSCRRNHSFQKPQAPSCCWIGDMHMDRPNGPWLHFLLRRALSWASKFLLSALSKEWSMVFSFPFLSLLVPNGMVTTLKNNDKMKGDWPSPIYLAGELQCLRKPQSLCLTWCHDGMEGAWVYDHIGFHIPASSCNILWY